MSVLSARRPLTRQLEVSLGVVVLAVAVVGSFWLGSRFPVGNPPPAATSTPVASPTAAAPTPVGTAPTFVRPDSSPPIGAAPEELLGMWAGGGTTVVLHDCSIGQECGVMWRIDDNNERCVYSLTLSKGAGTGLGTWLTFETSRGNSFGCAWSPWAASSFTVTLVGANALELQQPVGRQPIELQRA